MRIPAPPAGSRLAQHLVGVALVAASCSSPQPAALPASRSPGPSSVVPTAPPAVVAPTVAPTLLATLRPEASPLIAPVPSPSPAARSPDGLDTARSLQEFLARRYGPAGSDAPWYFRAQGVGVRGDTVIIRADLSTTPDDRRQARAICAAVSEFIDDPEHRALGVTGIRVYGNGYVVLVDRQGPHSSC